MSTLKRIEVIHIREAKANADKFAYVYAGRGSPLGNPYPMSDESERDSVCDEYHDYFIDRVQNDPEFVAVLDGLVAQYRRDGYLRLACFCAPNRCHVDTIRGYLLSRINS